MEFTLSLEFNFSSQLFILSKKGTDLRQCLSHLYALSIASL